MSKQNKCNDTKNAQKRSIILAFAIDIHVIRVDFMTVKTRINPIMLPVQFALKCDMLINAELIEELRLGTIIF